MTLAERAAGCLLGGAVGDALGAAVEFDSLADIRRRFGPAGIRDYAPAYGRLGAITDDTQMTLFTAEGLILARRDGADPVASVRAAYGRWLGTQDEPERPGGTGLAALPQLNRRRGPGATCLAALRAGGHGTPERPVNHSKGCGAAMRIAPVGIAEPEPFALASRIGALTHGHPSGHLSAAALAVVIARVARGAAIEEGVAAARAELAGRPGAEETEAAIAGAVALAARGAPAPEQLERLGGGWVGEEALAIGLACALTARDLHDGVCRAVNHGGDSDSTGAIAGSILGAALGPGAIPPHLIDRLELAPRIAAIARALTP